MQYEVSRPEGIVDSSISNKVLSSRKNGALGLSYQVGISIFSKMIAFVSLYLYANILPSDQISKLAILQALIVGVVAVLSIQLPTTLFRHSIEISYINSCLWLSSKSNIVLYISIIIIPVALYSNYSNYSLMGVALVLGLVQIAAFLKLEIIRAVDQGSKYYGLILLQILASVSLTFITLRYFYKSNGILVYAAYEFISWMLVFIMSGVIIKKWRRENEERRAVFIKEQIFLYLKYGVFLIPTAVAWWLITQAPLLISGYLLNSGDVAMYAISNRIPNMIAIFAFIILPVGGKNLALIYQVDPSGFKKKFFRYSIYWSMAFLLISIVVLIMNWFFLTKWYPDYRLGFVIQLLQVANSFFIAVLSFLTYAYISTKKIKCSSLTSIITGVIGAFISYILGLKFGLIGVIGGMSIGIIIGLALTVLHIRSISLESDSF